MIEYVPSADSKHAGGTTVFIDSLFWVATCVVCDILNKVAWYFEKVFALFD